MWNGSGLWYRESNSIVFADFGPREEKKTQQNSNKTEIVNIYPFDSVKLKPIETVFSVPFWAGERFEITEPISDDNSRSNGSTTTMQKYTEKQFIHS